jgi:Mrp family chromosome partitioning ATPase
VVSLPVADSRPLGLPNLVVAVLVALGGLTLAWLLLRRLRPRVATVEDAEDATELVVIGSVPRRGMRQRFRTMTGRTVRPPTDSFSDIVRVLEQNGLGQGMRVLTIVPTLDRSVASSFAVDLAHALAVQGHDLVLVLGNFRQPATDVDLPPLATKGLAELLQQDCRDPTRLLVSVAKGLLLLPSGTPREDPAQLLRGLQLPQIIASLCRIGQIVIIDAPPARFAADVQALAGHADTTLLVVYAGSLWRMVRKAAGLVRSGEAADPAAVLVGGRRRFAVARAVRLPGVGVRGQSVRRVAARIALGPPAPGSR